MGMLWIRMGLVLLLSLSLTACGGQMPDRSLVEKAIALQFSQTQAELAQQLRVSSANQPSFSFSEVKIEARQPLQIDQFRGFRVEGTYELTLVYPNRSVVQRHNPFEVYLQRQAEGKTWRLARLQVGRSPAGNPDNYWVTQLIQ